MQGVYEHDRDERDVPICWRLINDEYYPHFHAGIELAYILRGEMLITLDGKRQILHAGQLAIAPSYIVHSYQSFGFCESVVLIIPPSWIPFCKSILEGQTFQRLIYDDDSPDGPLLSSMLALADILRDNEPPQNPTLVRGYLYVILGILIEKVGLARRENECDTHLVRDILVFLQEHYTENVSQKTLAEQFGYSQSRFSHIFNNAFGCGVPEYLYSLRCRRAGELIADGVPILHAALSSGFESPRTFYRCFRQYFGMTPSEYLKIHRANESAGKQKNV